jgi:hypothetical protein
MTRPIVLNQSYVKTYQDCQRLYGWIRLQRLESVKRRSAPEIGTAVHKGLEILHAEGGTIELALPAAREKLKERSGPQSAFEDKSLDDSQEIVDRVLPAYVEHWSGQDELWAPLGIEVQFLVPVQPGWWYKTFSGECTDEEGRALEGEWIQNPSGIWLRGKSDNLSIHGGALWLVDYKTAGRMSAQDLLKYELDMQLSAYIYGLSRQLTQDSLKDGGAPIRVEGAIIDLLVKTKVPQFARESYSRTDEELHEFELEIIEIGTRIRNQVERIEAGEDWKIVFPRSTNHCFRYGTCAFRDLCLKDTDVRRQAFTAKERDYVDEAQDEVEGKKPDGEEKEKAVQDDKPVDLPDDHIAGDGGTGSSETS